VAKLGEHLDLSLSLKMASEKFSKLQKFLIDFSFVLDEMSLETLTEDLIVYGLELCRQGAVE
jgi:hypothetical protein